MLDTDDVENIKMETEKLNAEDNEFKRNQQLDLDKVLVEEIGEFGLYQVKMMALCGILILFLGLNTSEYLFTTARIPTRCLILECETASEAFEKFTPIWLTQAVPTTSTGFDNCHRYAAITNVHPKNGTCSAMHFDSNIIVPCETYVYENKNTIVYDYKLACDEWRRTLLGSSRTMGTVVAVPLAGLVSDRWGRRVALAILVINSCWIALVRYWATNYVSFFLNQLFGAALGSGAVFSCSFVLAMEMVGPKYRVTVGAIMNIIFSLSHALLGLISWLVPYWRTLILTLYLPQLSGIVFVYLVPESARWLLSKGHIKEAENILKEMARINKKKLSNKTLFSLRQAAKDNKFIQDSKMKESVNEPWLVVLVFRHRAMLLRCIVSPIWWITFTIIYYGLAVNSFNLIIGDKYINFCVVYLVDIPGCLLVCFLVNRVGRKPVLAGAFFICTLMLMVFILIPADYVKITSAAYILGKFSISTVGVSVYLYNSELYPTTYRHRLFAFSSMMGRLGSVLAPLTPAFGGNVAFILFAVMGLIAGLLVLLTPETLGTKLPDTMEEAVNMSTKTKLLTQQYKH